MLQKYSKLFKEPRGESLIEVITAIFVLVVGSSVATSIIVTSTQSNSFNRDNLIALNLAIEGVEAIRTIRDNNWLRFSFDKENCWNILPKVSSCDPGDPKKIEAGNYTAGLDASYAWNLNNKKDSKLDLDPSRLESSKDFQLKLQARGTSPDKQNIYNDVAGDKGYTKDSPFYRMITIGYDGKANDKMNVASTVQWLFQGRKHEITINDKLLNYQNIK